MVDVVSLLWYNLGTPGLDVIAFRLRLLLVHVVKVVAFRRKQNVTTVDHAHVTRAGEVAFYGVRLPFRRPA